MPCYHPLTGWPSRKVNPSGKRSITFSEASGFGSPVQVPCGQCLGCRIERSKMWSIRIVHEAQFHAESAFLTLTYSPEHLPAGGTLVLEDYRNFVKRLRSHLWRNHRRRVLFFGCGEYGDLTLRPHYHFIILGHGFLEDRQRIGRNPQGDSLYTHPDLQKLWQLGNSMVGAVTQQSAAYVARYSLKKVTGDKARAAAHYGDRKPEFMTCSNGIGAKWFQQYEADCFPDDFIVHKGRKHRVPKYYDQKLPPEKLEIIKAARLERAAQYAWNQTPERLAVREEVTKARLSTLKRNSAE